MRKIVVLVVSLALLGGACGKKKDHAAAIATTASGIRAKLLTESDVVSGFKRTSVDVDNRESSPIGCRQLDQVDEQYLKTTEHTAEAAFQNGDDATATQFIDETLYTFKTVDEAKAYYDANVAGFNACKNFDSTDTDGTRQFGTLQPFAFPVVADGSTAFTMTFNTTSAGQTQTLAGSVVIVRKSNAFVGILSFHVNNQPGLSVGEVETIVRKAADKV